MPLLTTFAADGVSAYGFTRGGAAAGAYELISTTTGTGSNTSVSFTSIPQTYKHLQIRMTHRETGAFSTSNLTFNSDTAGNYSLHYLMGNGSSVASGAGPNETAIRIGASATTARTTGNFAATIVDILDYSSTVKYKTIRALNGITELNQITLGSGSWRNTAAVTTITLPAQVAWLSGSRFSLYGIKG